MKKALITGITGQDGSYLAEFLLEKGYEVHGLRRRSSKPNTQNIEHILDKINLISGDILDQSSIKRSLEASNPDEVYNLASQSFVKESWNQPVYTAQATGIGVTNVLEAIRDFNPKGIKFYQASSSEMFGNVEESPQSEKTLFRPRSPYGAAKLYAHWMAINYRESYGIFTSSGILFNHESPRRGIEFVTKKITDGVAKIKYGLEKELVLGNLDAKRDWGYAKDYVEAMWMMLQNKEPKDFVCATGESHSIREFSEIAFNYVGLNYKNHVKTDPKFCRPAEIYNLVGDASKIREELGWKPRVKFEELVTMMMDYDLERLNPKK